MPEDNGETIYTVTVTFGVGAPPDEQLRDERAIRDEVESWLASLEATVYSVTVHPGDAREPR